jgi:hypothetical protein
MPKRSVIDPINFTAPWHLCRTYRLVAHVHRMVYEDCEGEERNPIVNGRFTLAPPPPPATPLPATAPNSAPSAQCISLSGEQWRVICVLIRWKDCCLAAEILMLAAREEGLWLK